MPYNPFARWRITGSWAAHASYSLGGEDYPLPYGTPLPAPASGTLWTSGRARPYPEFQAGQVGSAGRRSILVLDRPIGDAVAVVFQHQSSFGSPRHYDEGETVGYSGASANGKDWGGDVHLHIHCLDAQGRRRPYTNYFSGSQASAGPSIPGRVTASPISGPSGSVAPIEEDDMFTDSDRDNIRGQIERLDAKIDAFRRKTEEDHTNIGSNTDRRSEDVKATVQQEGALLKVLFNKASGVHALASVGLRYWWEIGADINKENSAETWAARQAFGRDTLAIYRAKGFAQTWVHEVEESEFNFYRMLCTNSPVNVEDERVSKIQDTVTAQGILLAKIAAKLDVS